MNRTFACALIACFLTACVSSHVRGDSPASDLDALAANVKRTAQHSTLPDGKEYCVENSRTEDEHDTCAVNLEDALFVGNGKLDDIVTQVEKAVQRIKLKLQPCGWFKSMTHPRECNPP